MDDGAVRLLTWNVQGAYGVDVDRVAAVVGAAGPDIVALQEVQRRQASALARRLSMTSRRWVFKHWPVVARAEGLAVLTGHRLVDTSAFLLRRRPFWDWRRRIGLDAVVAVGDRTIGVIDVHLSAHDDVERRRREAAIALARAGAREPAPFIVGDLNDQPDLGAHAAFVAAGWLDCWRAVHGGEDSADGSTNWTSGARAGRPPTQRIDYILAPPGATVEACTVIAEPERFDDFSQLSDHLPLVASIRLGDDT